MRVARLILMILPLFFLGMGEAVAVNAPPYWASIVPGKARMRTGPGRNFPASWLYQRAGLPVKVIETYPNWRKVEDPDGTQGWMQANLLSDDRTVMIIDEVRPIYTTNDRNSRISWRAEPGVIGKLVECRGGWCQIDIGGKIGFVETSHIWGSAELK